MTIATTPSRAQEAHYANVFGPQKSTERYDFAKPRVSETATEVWHDLQEREHIVRVTGRASTMGFLAGEMYFFLSSGRTISVVGENVNMMGAPFSYEVPPRGGVDAGSCTVMQRRVL